MACLCIISGIVARLNKPGGILSSFEGESVWLAESLPILSSGVGGKCRFKEPAATSMAMTPSDCSVVCSLAASVSIFGGRTLANGNVPLSLTETSEPVLTADGLFDINSLSGVFDEFVLIEVLCSVSFSTVRFECCSFESWESTELCAASAWKVLFALFRALALSLEASDSFTPRASVVLDSFRLSEVFVACLVVGNVFNGPEDVSGVGSEDCLSGAVLLVDEDFGGTEMDNVPLEGTTSFGMIVFDVCT
mmetsp:Transcript_31149/g.41566  ORF Transcript_31149/g.41566 Transcript_31149/m.41566 type:complete len:250 (-) Transcript_31149:291-1040(-)